MTTDKPNPTHEAVDALLAANGVTVAIAGAGATKRDDWECDAWRVTFRRSNKEFTTDYFTGIGHRSKPTPHHGASYTVNTLAWHSWQATRKPVKPHVAGVLQSLILDASALDENFGDWCANFDYSEDSIKALGTYTACCDNGRKLRATLGRDLVEQLAKLLEDY